MRRIRYSVAASLDGFIAGPNGEYDWIPMDPEIDFAELFSQFDTFIMGRRSFEVWNANAQEGGPEVEIWVFSRTLRQEDHPGVTIVSDDIPARVEKLRSREGKDIWLYGGGDLFRSLLQLDLVDTIEVAVVPVILGGGIPLLPAPAETHSLTLTNHRHYATTGTVLLEYSIQRRSASRPG